MAQVRKGSGLSPEDIERIKAAQKRHAAFDPGCEIWTPEEFINWHPIGGMSWEERAQRMKEAGITDPSEENLAAKDGTESPGELRQEVPEELPILAVSG